MALAVSHKTFIFFFALFVLVLPASARAEYYVIERVVDGDTVVAAPESEPNSSTKIRLCGIDAPEKNQEAGTAASAALADWLPKGKVIYLEKISVDRYKRIVANIWDNNSLINQRLVEEGLAWLYPRYMDDCFPEARVLELVAAQKNARARKKGLWNASNDPVPPWIFRRQ